MLWGKTLLLQLSDCLVSRRREIQPIPPRPQQIPDSFWEIGQLSRPKVPLQFPRLFGLVLLEGFLGFLLVGISKTLLRQFLDSSLEFHVSQHFQLRRLVLDLGRLGCL